MQLMFLTILCSHTEHSFCGICFFNLVYDDVYFSFGLKCSLRQNLRAMKALAF